MSEARQEAAPPNAHYPINDAWVARQQEPIIDPDLPIVDPHHHLWDRGNHRYLLPDLLADLGSGHNVVATVFIECTSMYRRDGPPELMPLGETEFVNGIAAMSATGNYGPVKVCAGIVPHVNLQLGAAARELLEAHLRAAGERIVGVRNSVNWHPDPSIRPTSYRPPKKPCPPGILLDGKFQEGVGMLAQLGLGYDCWLFHNQLDELAALAAAVPQATIVTNHIGGAMGVGPYEGKLSEVFADWKLKIRNLARRPNVYMKLGGLGMRMFGLRMGYGDRENPASSSELAGVWRPYIETCIEAFGPQRCMFESNFPPDKGTCSYAVVWNTFKRLASGASAQDKNELFSGTAMRAYRLKI